MPGPYDGYLVEAPDGWKVEAAGVPVGTFAEKDVALAVLAEHAASRACWEVAADGSSQRIG